jgi:aryl-alcohol dehydrogenase-like predicted oxidoreductase
MDILRLGKSGLQVSRICLGTMTFGGGADEVTSFQLMDRFMELGGTFLDTADQYTTGVSEEIVGRWIKERRVRDQVVLATKVFSPMSDAPNDRGLSRIHIQRGVEASLKRLQTDVIDLYQIHRWCLESEPEETLEALNDLVRQGKVRYIGCSNLKAWHLAKYLNLSKEMGFSRFISIQPIYSALNRSIENEVLELCAEEGLGVIVYNPLAGGVLTGKYARGATPAPGTRLGDMTGYQARYMTEDALDLVDAFVAAAKARGVTPAQLALAWVMAEPRVTCPIIGARTMAQLNDTIGGIDLQLSPSERAAIPAMLPGRWVGVDPVYDRS